MVNAIVVCGARFKAPTYYDFQGLLLDGALADINFIIDEKRKIWKKGYKSYNILIDSSIDRRGRTLKNFLVSSTNSLVFLKFVDV